MNNSFALLDLDYVENSDLQQNEVKKEEIISVKKKAITYEDKLNKVNN